jgi:hypothetical protein
VVVLSINVPVEFSLLYTTRSSLDLAFKQSGSCVATQATSH